MTIQQHQQQGADLALSTQQTAWTSDQRAALEHIGVERASEGDLQVFLHVCKRTGLDPFARQIYMIERQGKQTIQTGIDGFRLIGRRAADQGGETVAVDAPQWASPNGGWHEVWTRSWGNPLAARVTLYRAGQPFTALAMFEEYAATKKDGDLTKMWSERPAGQLAKCAEALAWRMAFPQDLSGIYAHDEMHQADRAPRADQSRGGLSQALSVQQQAATAEPMLDPHSDLAKAMFAAMNKAGITERDARLALCSEVTGRDITSSSDLTEAEAHAVLGSLPQQDEAPR